MIFLKPFSRKKFLESTFSRINNLFRIGKIQESSSSIVWIWAWFKRKTGTTKDLLGRKSIDPGKPVPLEIENVYIYSLSDINWSDTKKIAEFNNMIERWKKIPKRLHGHNKETNKCTSYTLYIKKKSSEISF